MQSTHFGNMALYKLDSLAMVLHGNAAGGMKAAAIKQLILLQQFFALPQEEVSEP